MGGDGCAPEGERGAVISKEPPFSTVLLSSPRFRLSLRAGLRASRPQPLCLEAAVVVAIHEDVIPGAAAAAAVVIPGSRVFLGA